MINPVYYIDKAGNNLKSLVAEMYLEFKHNFLFEAWREMRWQNRKFDNYRHLALLKSIIDLSTKEYLYHSLCKTRYKNLYDAFLIVDYDEDWNTFPKFLYYFKDEIRELSDKYD